MFFDGRSEILPYMTELWQQVESVIGCSAVLFYASSRLFMEDSRFPQQ